jgi:copper oxidase (laccase) domain-containing protein
MRALGATRVVAAVGPCIRPECYEFGAAELDDAAARFGDGVRATTADGRPAFDLPAAVHAALERAGVAAADVTDSGICTACTDTHFSVRARKDRQRQAAVIWR